MTAPNDLPSILPGIDSFVSAASVDVTSAQEVFARNFLEGIFRPWFQSFQGKEQPPSTTPTSETQHSRWYSHGMVQEEESSIECPTEESPETMAEPEPAQVAVGGPITIPLEPPKEESLLEIEKTISESRSGEMWKLATKPTLPENDCPTIQEKEESTMIMSSNKSRSVWESRVKLLPLSNPFDKAFDTLNPCPPCTMNYSRPNRWKPWLSWSQLRFRRTALGCFSSAAVLVIRLWLDREPTASLIHSIVVFLDMTLIHWFTKFSLAQRLWRNCHNRVFSGVSFYQKRRSLNCWKPLGLRFLLLFI